MPLQLLMEISVESFQAIVSFRDIDLGNSYELLVVHQIMDGRIAELVERNGQKSQNRASAWVQLVADSQLLHRPPVFTRTNQGGAEFLTKQSSFRRTDDGFLVGRKSVFESVEIAVGLPESVVGVAQIGL
jgi:hypothetical protein